MDFSWLFQFRVLIVFCLTSSVSWECGITHTPCDWMTLVSFEKCCNTSRVPINSVEIDYFVTRTDNSEERWRLDATLRWKAPTEDGAYMYSVDLVPTVTLEDLALYRIDAIENRPCQENEEETSNFTSILFGFRYEFQVQVIHNGVIPTAYTCFFCLEDPSLYLQAPDCLIATGDIEFCQNQPIPISTEPRDVKVDWTMESMSVIVNIKWSMPLVVNGKIAGYTIRARRFTTESIIFFKTTGNHTEIEITSESPGIRNGGFLAGYSYDILVAPIISLPAQYRSQGTTYEGNLAIRRISIPAIDVTTSKVIHTVTEGANPTTKSQGDSSDILPIALLLSSMSAVIVAIVAVSIMLLYIQKHT
ncbi:hypothetical protein HOLleu_35422 [Holothuria leucospilota]|uniref:Fibronectin type-III domain-containing protein n=1 Tax=Holothuria leucospilota TaxID=206669 RepID=A0A9Q1BHC4_HOLLE|nr:hypothetical protein HOLleu_35422 [Holothuria leucospilota]